ncbi:MAG: T9SS type A sorting domain-containing protein [Bacteroidota bacterium]|nr:T9SS type A sorting domain-containing protein [Bacteroidota bacterium]
MRILIFILGLLFIGSINAQSSFYKLYSSNGFDIGKGVAEYSDSSFLICGSSTSWGGSTQMVLLKLDSTGAYQWSNQYGGNESDGANRVLYNEAEGVFAVGSGNSLGAGDFDGLVLHTDEFGNEIWQKSFGFTNSWDFLNDAVFGNDTSLVMVGNSQDVSSGNRSIYMVRSDVDGNELWSQQFSSFANSSASSITNVQDSLFVVGGSFYSTDSLIQKGFLMKINLNGDVLWHKTLGNLSGAYSVEDVSLGIDKIYVTGSRKLNENDHDKYSAIFDFDGNAIIEKTEVDGAEIRDHIGDEICFVSNVNMPICGDRQINQFTFQDDFDVNLAYYTPNSLIWMNNFTSINNAGLDQTGQILETSDGGFIAVGQTTFPMSGGSNIFIFKSSPDGSFPVTADYFIIDTLVGMTENTETKLHVYPNPSKGLFHVNSDSSDEKKVRIYDTFGKLIFEASVFQNQDIDLTPYQDGVYLLRIEQKIFKLMKFSD